MDQEPVLSVTEGKLKGKICTDYNGREYYSFQGIPYAKPPVGELRFKAPVPPDPWTDIKDATKEGNDCFAKHLFLQQNTGSEDCLYLNVYTPNIPPNCKTQKPVMVWIHGGAFVYGSGSSELYGPDYLITEDVVVVTINYRLGLLGFLCLDDTSLEVPGNAGLKDQIMALKWVQNNISNFGGDPNNVTIFGESAGGASVHYIMLSPLGKDLFHKAIIQSGSALCYWAKGQVTTPFLAKHLKLNPKDERELLNTLQCMSVEEVLTLQESLDDHFLGSKLRSMGPVIEKENPTAFITEDPRVLLKSGKHSQVPLMMGFTSREGMLAEMGSKLNIEKKNSDNDLAIHVPYMLNLEKDEVEKLSANLKEYYYNNEEITDENKDYLYVFNTDNMILREMYRSVKFQMMTFENPIYFYRMSVETELNFFKKFLCITNPGAAHGDDIGYLFKPITAPEIRTGSIEDISIKRFVKLWTRFAYNGDPNPMQQNSLINIKWEPIENDKLNFLDIGENLTVGVNPEIERMNFWTSIFKTYLDE